ncbi:MAG: hypothetical protein GF400_02065 [Candidatus Eisenbacteria bacterium]|nr:hypothetical protein [Candidatus Eisenbacteria bacterium]
MRHGILRVALAVAALAAALPASAVNEARELQPRPVEDLVPERVVVWQDDLESGAPGWTHGDDSFMPAKFHVDSYLAYDDPEHEDDYSWWCGEQDPDYSGGDGYGNSWDQKLELPPIELGISAVEHTSWGAIKGMYREDAEGPPERKGQARTATPVLSFRYRHDTEAGYDFVYVEVLDGDEWVALNSPGYDGSSGGWQEAPGFSLDGYGDPVRIRFRFVSDGAWSDADGYYDSDGGAFHVDNIVVHDAVTGEVFYREDCEGGVGQSQPFVPEGSGDYWHLVDNACQAYSGTRCWSVNHPDSTHVPPMLRDWLQTPFVDLPYAVSPCTLHFVSQMFMTDACGGSWQEWGTNDGGNTWIRTAWWYGDQCEYGYGVCEHFAGAIPLSWTGHWGGRVAGKWVMLTDEFGNTSSPYCNRAGITIDDVWVEAWIP